MFFCSRAVNGFRAKWTTLSLLSVVWIGSFAGCGDAPEAARRESESTPLTDASADETGGQLPRLYRVPEFELTDQLGEPYGSQELKGKIWVATFMFTSCGATCPTQMRKFSELQGELQQWPHAEDVRLVAFSIDPARDTPERLRAYGENYGTDSDVWRFLTGDRDTIYGLASEGFKLSAAEDPLSHSSLFALVDAQGTVRGLFESMNDTGMDELYDALHALLREPGQQRGVADLSVPEDLFDTRWIRQRQQAQMEAAESIAAFHDFQFTDELERSGIQFLSRGVGDTTRNFRSNHYDHGCSVVTADVDGDGRLDLYFLSQIGRNELYRNLGDGRFEDITDAAGIALEDRVSVAASFADTDNDGDADLLVTTTRHGNVFFENQGDGTFVDRTTESGLEYVGHSSAADFFDYDRDGRLDVFVSNVGQFTVDEVREVPDRDGVMRPYFVGRAEAFFDHVYRDRAETSRLYHNEGGNRFRDVTEEMGLGDRGWAGDATPIDVNEDGWMDLYVLDMQGNDAVYVNQAGRQFVDETATFFPYAVWGGMGVKAFDADNDLAQELFVTNMHADMWGDLEGNKLGEVDKLKTLPGDVPPPTYLMSDRIGRDIFGNALFDRDAEGKYVDVSLDVGLETYWPWGPSIGDFNADGFEDVFVASSMSFPYRYHVNSLLLNEQGRSFRDAEFIVGIEPRAGWQTAVPYFTLDASGRDRDHDLSKGFEGEVQVWGAVGTRAVVILDLDDDGDLDIVTNEYHTRPQVLINHLNETLPTLSWLKIKLQGVQSNRDGLGARVIVELGDRRLMQVQDGQSGYLSQSSEPLYFGLEGALQVDRIFVEWPSGEKQMVSGPIEPCQTLVIEESGLDG